MASTGRMEDAAVAAPPPLEPLPRTAVQGEPAPGERAPGPSPRPAVEALLRDDPTSFEFFQAVRLLAQLYPEREPVGGFAHPSAEIARFTANLATAFPASEIQELALPPEGEAVDAPPRMAVNFMGLTGPLGVLPAVYTTHVAERVRAHDTALRDFLDLFHHRIISLFYRAWEKYRFTVAHERDRRDPLTRQLMDLVGIGTSGLEGRLRVPDEALLSYAGLLGIGARPAQALEQMLADYFDVQASVEQFVGAWYPLTASTQCRLGDEDMGGEGGGAGGRGGSEQLGLGAVVGDEIWDLQSRVRIRLGPLARRQYDQFLPGGSAHEPLRALVRFFSNEQFEFDIQLVLARDEVPGCTLGDGGDAAPPLGWCTWLRSAPFTRDPDETILEL